MALGTFIAGAYTATYNAVGTGITDGGYEVEQTAKAEMIDKSDVYGDTLLDAIYRGGECTCQFTSKEYMAGSLAVFWPWGGAAMGAFITAAMPIAVLASSIAKPLILTATANTPAAAAPATLTAPLALLAFNYPAKLLYDSRLRTLPIRLQLLPSTTANVTSWFTKT